VKGRGEKLTAHHHTAPGLRMRGSISLLPYISSWRGV